MDIFPADLYLHIQVTYHLFLTNLAFIVVTDGKLEILFGMKSKELRIHPHKHLLTS
jgi:hypothetical protein